MATSADNKGKDELLPTDDLAAIYDTNTQILYLYARGTYVTPALTSFVREFWIGALKFAFKGFYTDSPDPTDKPKPTEHQFVEEFHIKLPERSADIIIATEESPDGKKVPILPVPQLLL
jgi:hypothetical protein